MPFVFCSDPDCTWAINASGGDDYARAADYLALHRWYVHHAGDNTIRNNARLSHWVGHRDDLERLIAEDTDTARKVLGQFARQEVGR
jgi:hypothetical protein